LEAFLAEIQFEPSIHFPQHRSEFIEECFRLCERQPILQRFTFLAMLNGRSGPSLGSSPGQDVNLLIKLRNALVHYQPAWQGESRPHEALNVQLSNRFEKCAWLRDEGVFPRAWVSYSCCKWAVDSVREFVIEYATANAWPCGFSDLGIRQRFILA
jgi:hypothetical protein